MMHSNGVKRGDHLFGFVFLFFFFSFFLLIGTLADPYEKKKGSRTPIRAAHSPFTLFKLEQSLY